MGSEQVAEQLELDRVKRVFDERGMYDAVVEAGYMRHGLLAAALEDWARQQAGPLTIVDLGCGDAWLAARAFGDADVRRYVGVDASEASVERARQRLERWGDRAEVVVGNLADVLKRLPEGSANVVLASYSIHHFPSAGKTAVLADCGRVLAAGGTLFWIDLARREEERREEMIARLTGTIEKEWTALTPEAREKACAHIREADFPETIPWMREQAERAGLAFRETIFMDEFFVGMRFVKRSEIDRITG